MPPLPLPLPLPPSPPAPPPPSRLLSIAGKAGQVRIDVDRRGGIPFRGFWTLRRRNALVRDGGKCPIGLQGSNFETRRFTWFAAAVVSLTWALATSATATAQSIPPAIEGDFQIGRDGRLMVVPVRLRDREILCLLDTGASLTGFDVSLRDDLGKPIGTRVVNAARRLTRVESYEWPTVTIGGRGLSSAMPVISINLENVPRASNEKIYGVIGMDVLRSCRLQIDFDHGRLRFLKSLPRDTA